MSKRQYQAVWPSGPTAAERVTASVARQVAVAVKRAKAAKAEPAPWFTFSGATANPTRVRVA